MKINYHNSVLTVTFSKSLFIDQAITIAFASAFVIGTFWYAPEQLGW